MDSIHVSEDVITLPPRAIALTEAQVEQARQRSQAIANSTQQWQAYLNTLALLGFEQWLHQRASDISIDSSQALMEQSADLFPVVCNITVNQFKLCLIPIESQPDEVELPRRAVMAPTLAAHFYVAIAIYEEHAHVAVHSFLRRDQLLLNVRSRPVDSNDVYTLPITAFEPDLNQLLLYLRCAQPTAISIANGQPPIAALIRVRQWLQTELDALAQQAAWVLLPPTALEDAMRITARVVNQPTPQEGFAGVVKQLTRDGITLPTDARTAYHDLEFGPVPARLYAIAGTLPPTPDPPAWTLLLILGPRSQTPLPRGLHLQIRANQTILMQQTLNLQDAYLYAKVIGTLDEQFAVTIILPDGEAMPLPTFSY